MFDDAKKPLFPSCKRFTKLLALVRLYNLKVRFGWSDASFSELLTTISEFLPENNEIKDLAEISRRPKCNILRWKTSKNSHEEIKGVATKQLLYFPIVLRFLRMFKNFEHAKNLCWHENDRKVDGVLRHPIDTPSWRCYLSPLIDDLKLMWEEGVHCFDAHKEELFTLRAILLWTINDFPTYGEEIYNRLKDKTFPYGKRSSKRLNEDISNEYWKRISTFYELVYWKKLHVKHCLDVMHIEKNVSMNIIGTLLDISGKSKDGLRSRLDLVEMNIRPELAPVFDGSRTYKRATCYTLSREEKVSICKTLFDLKVPEG
ncbi:putative polyprotein [Cucumis melo var. makuwa]|uniref:Polyprotein n=1 Tax=Cucumis melo var. makuwa TaxID=1194695 RepID=A0A5D3C302_CUCMM|nr:putative polyprotein [Cucumis melo var. makuwa]TYK04816.1 putative polyprotein [Cucumis melo var. makuwa]